MLMQIVVFVANLDAHAHALDTLHLTGHTT